MKLQSEFNRLGAVADRARIAEARKNKVYAGLSEGSGFKSEFEILTDDDKPGWTQGDQRTQITAREKFIKQQEMPTNTGKKAILKRTRRQSHQRTGWTQRSQTGMRGRASAAPATDGHAG